MTESDPNLVDLASWLARHGEGATLVLTQVQAAALHAEMQRLRQSADRLRKQNRKVRRKYDRLRGEDGESGDPPPPATERS